MSAETRAEILRAPRAREVAGCGQQGQEQHVQVRAHSSSPRSRYTPLERRLERYLGTALIGSGAGPEPYQRERVYMPTRARTVKIVSVG